MKDPAGALAAVRARVDAAARSAGRDPAEVALLAVSKTWPVADVVALAELGQREFAENKVQDLVAKAEELAHLDLRWHLVGQLQRNKATAVVGVGAVVQSVDRVSLVERLAGVAERAELVTEVFVQVDLGGPEGGPPPGAGWHRSTPPSSPTRWLATRRCGCAG
ncbi:hypothetical protein ACFQX8_05350 [Klenkia terrae]|uniref:hypothetical protein n=1 Tax=Klenkia terrae TaxID=1052259 RepID=UPI0036178A68